MLRHCAAQVQVDGTDVRVFPSDSCGLERAVTFPTLTDGERKHAIDPMIAVGVIQHKQVAVCRTPPLSGLGFLSTSLAPKEEKPKVPELIIYLACDLPAYSRAVKHGVTRVSTQLSGREYTLRPLRSKAQTAWGSPSLRALSAPALQTAAGPSALLPKLFEGVSWATSVGPKGLSLLAAVGLQDRRS
jgi:hypothetical protein